MADVDIGHYRISAMKQTLQAGLDRLGLALAPDRIDALCRFGAAVIEKNKVMNLTAITEPQAVAELHLLDSLTLCKVLDLSGKSLLDVGTGAGFPGVPLKIAVPSLELTLLDSLQKRMRWLQDEALPALGITAAVLAGRAEDYARPGEPGREGFDVVSSRAVARLNVLCALCLPFVRPGGYFLAMKGQDAAEELQQARRAIETLGGRWERTETFELGGQQHRVLVIRKVRQTPPQYPRAYAKIKQKPL